MKKKLFIGLLILFVCLFVSGCEFNKEVDYSDAPFVGRWVRAEEYDDEYLGFSDDGGFVYYCGCGNPVDNYDLCEEYTYNEKTKTIKIKCTTWTEKVKVVSYDDDTLELNFDGEIRKFIREGREYDD